MRKNIREDLISMFNKDKKVLRKILNYRINTTKKEIKKLDRDYHYLKDKRILEEKRILKKNLEIYRKIIRILFYKKLDNYLKSRLPTSELNEFKIVIVEIVLNNEIDFRSFIIKHHINLLNKITNSITINFKDTDAYPLSNLFNAWLDFMSDFRR